VQSPPLHELEDVTQPPRVGYVVAHDVGVLHGR
jgi:hypothetical protein